MYHNKQNFNFHNLMVRVFFSVLVLSFAVLSCKQSEPNPINGVWIPDTNLNTKIVFSEKMEVHNCGKVSMYNYSLENFGKELILPDSLGNERVLFLYFLGDKIRVSENEKSIIFTKAK